MSENLLALPEQFFDEPQQHLEVMKPPQLRALAKQAHNELMHRSDPADMVKIAKMFDAIEDLMHAAGLYGVDEILPINQDRMLARWKLGQALAKIERHQGARTDKKTLSHGATKFRDFLKALGLDKDDALRAQRIGALPDEELKAAFKEAEKEAQLLYFDGLIKRARPWWLKASCQRKHKKIKADAKQKMVLEHPGPFPLIYADPPWKVDTYSPKGLERSAARHYPTLSDQEIIDYTIGGRTINDIAHRDAALLLWCTSSGLERALAVMSAWGFKYKVSAVWVKTQADGNPCTGLGFVFRNAHELLLYGTRGNMPGPQHNPPSVFLYQRGEHSAKPPEIRKEIEKMFPDFDETTRLELFARDKIAGWTTYGFEACEPASKIAPEEPVKIVRVHIPLINSEPVDRIEQHHLQRRAERASKEAGIG